jgi:murein DD-endopeptidase MepM/ murein hydrolase activator NlpD
MVAMALIGLGAWLAGSEAPSAHAAGSGRLQQQISAGRGRVSRLAGDLSAANRHVARLGSSISALSGQLAALQSDLDAKRAELLSLRARFDAAQVSLRQLEARQAGAEQALAVQLTGSYEEQPPDLVSVVLEATGFHDLLERLAFVQRIGRQDASVAGRVQAARRAVAAEAIRLGALSARAQRLAESALADRNRVATVKLSLVSQRLAAARVQAAKAGQLASARSEVASLSAQLVTLRRARAAPSPSASPSGSGSASSPSSSSSPSAPSAPAGAISGGFEFPMPKAAVAPPSTWSLDDGVDIAAPGGPPELAVCSGTVVLHGIGGFGPSAPVLHCDSPLAGYDYVYYGHAGPGNWVPIGTHVSQGQVISQVGYGIVGISSGPHLEIGFGDSSGSPIGPSSAPQMMSLLQAAYAR